MRNNLKMDTRTHPFPLEIKGTSTLQIIIICLFIFASVALVFYLRKDTPEAVSDVRIIEEKIPEKKTTIPENENKQGTPGHSEGEGSAEQEAKVQELVDKGYKGMIVLFKDDADFTEEEKSDIRAKMVEPFFDFNFDNGTEYTLIQVEKYNGNDYKYSVYAYAGGGIQTSFLYGNEEPLNWWIPECLNGCNFTPEFEEIHPEVVTAYNSAL